MTATNGHDPRVIPKSDLDLQMMLTDNEWGKLKVSTGLGDQLNKEVRRSYKAGESLMIDGVIKTLDKDCVLVEKESVWSVLQAVYVRDLRLSFLTEDQIVWVTYYLDLAHDILQSGYPIAFVTTISRVASVVEPSQSKKGWLRNKINTITQERIDTSLEPKKKSLWGRKKE